jgi:hypothetical protein
MVVGFGCFTLLSIPTIVDPGKGGIGLQVASVGFTAVLIWLTIRAFGSATIVATEQGVRYRNVARDRRWAWDDLEQFEARDGRVGAMGYRRRVLFVRQANGALRKLEAINARPTLSPNPVDEVATCLNGLLDGSSTRPPDSA